LIADEAMRAGRIMQHIHNFIRKGQLRTESVSMQRADHRLSAPG